MLDIRDIRERKKEVLDVLRKRFLDDLSSVVEEIERKDKMWRSKLKELNALRAERNSLAKEFGKALKEGKDVEALREKAKEIEQRIKVLEDEVKRLENEIKEKLKMLPNFLHPDVPIGPDESYNKPIKVWGRARVFKDDVESFKAQLGGLEMEYDVIEWKPPHHYDLTEEWGLADTERASKTSGSRFYYERGAIVFLDLALSMWALDELRKKGFTPIIPPYMMRRFVEEAATTFSDFEEVIYKVEEEDLYLIPTAEHALLGYHANEIFEMGELPKRYVGWSPCFRKEAGAHGKDTKGIFRVHQFHKVEQFSYVYPEDSWNEHKYLLKNAEEFYQRLEIPYRVVDIASGDLGFVAARKYDIEAWFPGQGKFREVVSCSNCLAWQARRANIRYRRKDGKTDFVHTLNSTAIATQRTICAILENHYDPEENVVRIPKVLWKYMPEEYREITPQQK